MKLTARRAALLYSIRHGNPPWIPDGERLPGIVGASEVRPGGVWIMCCGHVFGASEIAEMQRLGWIAIGTKIGRDGGEYRCTVAGPKIHDAWQETW